MTLFKDKDIVEDVRHLLTSPILRDIYDKSGTFTTIKMYKEANGSFPINMRYLHALGAGA